jgi:stearoyl-CoA desaturase (delta-9 desaturase)
MRSLSTAWRVCMARLADRSTPDQDSDWRAGEPPTRGPTLPWANVEVPSQERVPIGQRTGDLSDDIAYPSAIAFLLVHLACFAAFLTGVTGGALLLCAAPYLLRMFAITAGYHRYFSHRAFHTSRAFQFVLALLAQASAQKGPLWWAAHHRRHHRYSDTELDVHSPAQRGFIYAHVGWIFVPRNNPTDHVAVQDLGRFKELLWLDRNPYLPAALLAAMTWLFAGWLGLVVGFGWSTVAVWHATFSINSCAHVFGRPRYVTGDDSRNNWWLALLTLGEGWHNNHHAYQVSARQGFRWWEYDPTYYALWVLSWLHIVWDLRAPPQALMLGEQRLGRHVIEKVAGQLAASFPVNQIATRTLEALARAPGWTDLKPRFVSAGMRAELFWNNIDLPDIPTLEEVRRIARERLSQTPSVDEIAVRARERLLELVYLRLSEAVVTPGAG